MVAVIAGIEDRHNIPDLDIVDKLLDLYYVEFLW